MKHTPEEARKLWVEALRSGKYKQALRKLRVGNRFCCLGVACDLFRRHERRGRWRKGFFELRGYKPVSKVLPYPVAEWLGVTESNVSVEHQYTYSLAELNDSLCNFSEIADLIENGKIETV